MQDLCLTDNIAERLYSSKCTDCKFCLEHIKVEANLLIIDLFKI